MSYLNQLNVHKNDLGFDAWDRSKAIIDHTLFSALWTYDIPKHAWKEMHGTGNDLSTVTEQTTFTYGTSTNSMLNIKSGTVSGEIKGIVSKRHPRYQPNRGHLYSTAGNVPFPTRLGQAIFGLINIENGAYFRVKGDGTNHQVFVEILNNGIVTHSQDITALIPPEVDITLGTVYDIQMQWRGVGNIRFFIGLQKIFEFQLLGTLPYLSISNPALPAAYYVESFGEEYEVNLGCCDITSEGGSDSLKTHAPFTTGAELIDVAARPTAMLAVQIPETYNGNVFTRDSVLTRFTSFCKDESMMGIYVVRSINAPNMNSLTWDVCSKTLYNTLQGGDASLIDNAFTLDIANCELVFIKRQEKDFSGMVGSPSNVENFYLSPGDILIATLDSDAAAAKIGGVTLELNVEI